MIIKTQKINDQTHDLKYGSAGAACFDLVSNADVKWKAVFSEGWDNSTDSYRQYQMCFEAIIPTGYQFQVPEGFRMDIYPRSGWGFKHNIQLANGTGKIDSDYRGEVQVKLVAFCNSEDLPQIEKGSRIAQAEINPVIVADFEYVDSLEKTERGQNGFGSTGVSSGTQS